MVWGVSLALSANGQCILILIATVAGGERVHLHCRPSNG